eukprot:SAG25_NODE_243_length_11142_cov_106.401069_8_plen_87_part_00
MVGRGGSEAPLAKAPLAEVLVLATGRSEAPQPRRPLAEVLVLGGLQACCCSSHSMFDMHGCMGLPAACRLLPGKYGQQMQRFLRFW